MKFKISKNYYTNCNLYDKSTIEVKDGLTIFVGCNGSGKSTLLRQIKDTLNDSNIPCLFYDYNTSGRENAKSSSLLNNQVELTGSVQKVYVTKEQELEVEKHIDDMINE